jgi:hypothetical protein
MHTGNRPEDEEDIEPLHEEAFEDDDNLPPTVNWEQMLEKKW